jgi:tetratricopeptide (TPR) repeat protein
MRTLIPATTEIELGNELRGLETTSQDLAVATKFVLALAFAVSDDWKNAKNTLLELLDQHFGNGGKRGKKGARRGGSAKDWRHSITKHLSAVSFADYCAEMEAWDQNRSDKQHLFAAEAALDDYRKFLDKSERQGDLRYLIAKANLEVSIRRNYAEAKRLLNRCRTLAVLDPTWRMSMAFVDAVVGDLDSALDLYDAAFGLTPDVSMVVSIEQYVQWWLQENSGPPGLHLLSALLNCDLKTDIALARQDLDSFTAKAPQALSPKVKRRVKELSERLQITSGEHAQAE